jgi:serine phosphatase RsbU (regulator of sigma subunit)/anti-sigma regulatory factor (Ser/Thr protein kinase)
MRDAVPVAVRDRLSLVSREDYEQEHRWRRDAEEAVHLLRVLAEVTSDLGGAHAEADVLDVVRRRIAAKLDASMVALWTLAAGGLQQLTTTSPRSGGPVLRPPSRVSQNRPPAPVRHVPEQGTSSPWPSPLLLDTVERREPCVLEGAAAAGVVSDLPTGGRVALVPLLLAERAVGLLEVAWDSPPSGFDTPAHRELLEAVASQVAQALDRSWLYEGERVARQEAEAAAKQLRLQQDLALCLANTTGLLHLASTIVDFAVTSLRSGGASLLQMDDQRAALRLLAVRAVPTVDSRHGLVPLTGEAPCARAARTREVVFHDLPLDAVDEPSQLVALPLILDGRVVGVLALVRPLIDEWDKSFLSGLSHQCALALERARLHDASQEKSRVLQRDLLPARVPKVPGLDLGIRYRPVSRHEEVGGDFYDIFQVNDDTWGILIGDVSGKGAAAASLTALARYTVRTAAKREGNLVRMLGLLNDAVLDATARDDRFCTVAYVEVSPGPPVRIRMVSGGHPLPMLLDASGRVRPVGTPGLAIGLLPGLHWSDERLTLHPGECLALYTDGVAEARSVEGAFADGLVEGILADADGADAEELADRIERVTLDFSEGDPRDDLAVVVLRALPVDEHDPSADSCYLTLERDPMSVPAARRAVRTFVRTHGFADAVEEPALALTGELVANAVEHAGTAVGLRTRIVGNRLRVEVSDGSAAVPPSRTNPDGVPTGRGTRMLTDLAVAWDVRRHHDRKTVWFEIDLH